MFKPIIISGVQPEIEAGHFPAKTETDRPLKVQACIFKDGHEKLAASVKYRHKDSTVNLHTPMFCTKPWEDLFEAPCNFPELGSYFFTIEAWVDRYASWLSDYKKRCEAGNNKPIDKTEGLALVLEAFQNSSENELLKNYLSKLEKEPGDALKIFAEAELEDLVKQYLPKHQLTSYEKELEVWVEPSKARFAAWYELFPRSASNSKFKHGTFLDCLERLAYVKELGFDVVYFPPIHPIGLTHRKGKNNSLKANQGEPGSPWAIGAASGGHKDIHPELGTLADFELLISKARELDLEIALDFAIQCSPDHPYVKQNKDWFFIRADGSIKYAENPPKEYQDIYPLNFWCTEREALWQELKSILLFWIERGVKTFRVDNPHTKPLAFWEWCLREVKAAHPEVVFLSEAFTKRSQMYALAKAGFSQSYTYFTWRNQASELSEYLQEITQPPVSHYFRGNLFANTPDILHEYLQTGGRAAFMIRAILAGTLSSVYGIYSGFELCENVAYKKGSEEYLDSEKYELKERDWNEEGHIKDLIKKLNRIRKDNQALHSYDNLTFYKSNNPNILVYGKTSPDYTNCILVVINLDPFNPQEGGVKIEPQDFKLNTNYLVQDLLSDQTYHWTNDWNYVRLDPRENPAHIFLLKQAF